MINIVNKEECCGCNACGDVCPKGAIEFKTDNEGFWYPVVDHNLCIDCKLCEKVCPIINIDNLKKNDLEVPQCYAAEHKNLEVVFDSTSGGLFSALADFIYRQNGYVGGAIFNDDFSVRHYISPDKKDLEKLRSSKYLQSNLEGFYKRVQSLLKEGNTVLVCGTPCQMAALRAYLKKDYVNLIIVDFICLGINSPKVWRKYLDSFEERYGSKVVYCKAKSKEYGWRRLTQKVILENGKAYYEPVEESNFTQGYIRTHAYTRPSCYECKFKGYPRMADITLADFWGIEKIDKTLEKDIGTSLVMINSEKGKEFFENIKKKINYIPIPFDLAGRENPALVKPLSKPNIDREKFFSDLDKMSFLEIADKYFKESPPKNPKDKLKKFISCLRKRLKYPYIVLKNTRMHIRPLWQFFHYNSFGEIIHKHVIIPTPHCLIQIEKGAHIEKKGVIVLGKKLKFKHSKLETRLSVDAKGHLVLGENIHIGYGADIEVFNGANLTIGNNVQSNLNWTIICGDNITIGNDVIVGRNVTIRDNNGDHYINRKGYRNSSPVTIGKKAWLCEQSTIMNGVTVGEGAIIGAKSFVIRNVPSHSMVSGHPAEVIDEDILWKY